MSISPAMINRCIHIAFFILLMLMTSVANAQFVAIRLEIPAGVQFGSQVMDPVEGGTWEKTKARRWVGIEADENLSILVQLGLPEREIQPTPEAYFLNDGSSDFEGALRLNINTSEVALADSYKLIKYMRPIPMKVKAWLGIPVIDGLTIKIEYP